MSTTTTNPKIANAWCLYDWANSAFATTVLAAVLPVYYSQVAGATLPSEATATAYWSLGLSISLLIVAILSPVLGTLSDISRSKKRFLALFTAIGAMSTAALVLVSTGDWLLASVLAILGRIGFNGALTFYDALLPHVAAEEDQDRISAKGYAMGYLGGGLLLAINIAMIQFLPGTWGARLSFVSVGLWWILFSIPLFRHVPEPHTLGPQQVTFGEALRLSFKRLRDTFRDIRRYKELFKYLIAFLIYNDGIGTIIGVSVIYGSELGFGSVELILALLLVQFAGIPFSLIFGRLPSPKERSRPYFLAFLAYSAVVLPLFGLVGTRLLPPTLIGAPLPAYATTATAAGEGTYMPGDPFITYTETWERRENRIAKVFGAEMVPVMVSEDPNAEIRFRYNGQKIEFYYDTGPQHGLLVVELDGRPYRDPDSGAPLVLDMSSPIPRYGVRQILTAEAPGSHELRLRVSAGKGGARAAIGAFSVLPPIRQNNLGAIIGMLLGLQVLGALWALATGKALFSRLAEKLDTKHSIILALIIYAIIALWGFFVNSTLEFWLLAWMVSIVQGGSQALSRSLYAALTPPSKSGEFFGLFSVMEKFASLLGPLAFAAAGLIFGSSRPAISSLVLFFVVGIYILTRVDVAAGHKVAMEIEQEAQ